MEDEATGVNSYFFRNAGHLSLLSSAHGGGLRRGQQGAIFAVGAHFTLHTTPAIVVMPTGAGKTVVLMLAPFLLGARRVLVLTPSRLVRDQIATLLRTLDDLRRIRAIPATVPDPKVCEVKGRVASIEDWRALESFDIVVATPNAVSPALSAVPEPPPDLFDMVLVDEAHHSPARTWNAALAAFPEAHRILFTATPFRSDFREIDGQLVYAYPVAEARKDGIFGTISYIPVIAAQGSGDDIAVARAAEHEFLADRALGLDHRLMVRTDTRPRADELADLYRRHTSLRLAVVHSGHGYPHVLKMVAALRSGDLDGIICVNMLGEGFDLPQLKIAAIHAPHKSLAVTLQFIGRFARTSGMHIGDAKFLAVPSDIEIQARRLYDESATWQELVPDLLSAQIEREVRARGVLQTFEAVEPAAEDFEDISLNSLWPYHHVKIYRATGRVELDADVRMPAPSTVVLRRVSLEHRSAVFVTRRRTAPRWTKLDTFAQTKYDLFIVYYHALSGLFFVCASRKSDALYDDIVEQFCPDGARRLPLATISKALIGLDEATFYNVGMRNRVLNSNTESYRIITGGNAHKAIRESDGEMYYQGHLFGRARDRGESVTIGLSSSSKIWSSTSSRIPDLLDWCGHLATRLASDGSVRTGSELDYLRAPEEAHAIPPGLIAATWHEGTYRSPIRISYRDDGGERVVRPLLDFDLAVVAEASDRERIRLHLIGPGLCWPVDFWLLRERHFAPASADQQVVAVDRRHEILPLVDYLNAGRLPHFYFADFSSLHGRDWLRASPEGLSLFSSDRIEQIDWASENADIEAEFGVCDDGRATIHDVIERRLLADGHGVILYDHGSGEVADYLAVRAGSGPVCFEFYHCKGSGGPTPGDRVGDLYEVCGQVIKARQWTHKHEWLIEHMRRRHRGSPERFRRGDLAALERMVEQARGRGATYRMIVVQPGVSRGLIPQKQAVLLSAADDFIVRAGCDNLRVIASA